MHSNKGSDWIRLVFAHPFPLNSRARIASANFIAYGKVQVSPYSLCQKKRTFNLEFFCGPPGEGGPKTHMVDYVNGSSIHAQFFSLENLQPF